MKRTKGIEKPAFAKNLIAQRKARGWSAQVLAEKARIPYPTLRDIEAGYNKGLDSTKTALADALGLTLGELYSDDQPTAPVRSALPLEVGGRELVRVLEDYLEASEVRQLIARYLLTDDETYLHQAETLPSGPQTILKLLKAP